MKIPSQITVGKTTYTVKYEDSLLNDRYMGEVNYDEGLITLCRSATIKIPNGNVIRMEYGAEEMHNSFWHEITHAILYDMGHNLHNNEHFVTQFANRLSDAVDSAKL
jgi:uncharacterized beta-barrel protein YwiB (DUF1934 family)